MPELEPITVTAQRIGTGDAQIQAARAAGASDADVSLINRFKQRANDFSIARAELDRMGPAIARTNDYDLMVSYGELVNRGTTIGGRIQAATNAIDAAVSWARGAIGDLTNQNIGALGVVWLLPGALLLGAIAIIGYWITDFSKFAQRFNEQQRIAKELVAQGVDPARAQAEAGRAVAATSPGMFAGVGNYAVAGVILLVGLFLFSNARR